MANIEKLHFITSSGIKNIVGKDLITDRFVAIFELVKNAYDAKATKVVVSFDITKEGKQSITIHDNGVGMSKHDLESKWLHLAYSEKKEGQSNDGRAFVGSKGIGRFSCDSLGSKLLITTKKKNGQSNNYLKVNWTDFEKSLEDRFEDIQVEYSTIPVASGSVEKSYTVLLIENLHDDWDTGAIKKVVDSLQRLKNPFNQDDGFDIYCGMNISRDFNTVNQIPEKYLIRSNISEVLKDKSITIEVQVGDFIKVDLSDRGKRIFSIQKRNETVLKGVSVFISINYLTASAKMTFARRMGIQVVNYGNIFIYRNGFRVSPYGDTNFDLFGLNLRKTQGYSRYLGTRELIGHIAIKDNQNIFRETSSRNNGFIENVYFDALREVYMDYAHKLLERYVNLINWGEDPETNIELSLGSVGISEAEKFKKSLSGKAGIGFELVYFADNLVFEDNDPQKQLQKIAMSLPSEQQGPVDNVMRKLSTLLKESEQKAAALRSQQQEIAILELQNKNISTRRPESGFGEQLSHHFPAMADRLNDAIIELTPLHKSLSGEDNKKFLSSLRKVRRTEFELRAFKNLLLNTSIDLRSPQILNWYDLANRFIKDKPPSARSFLKGHCTFSDGEAIKKWSIRSNAIEVMMMFENFYRNAIDHNATFLEISFEHDKILISSDSTPIDKENLSKVFELGFSTKVNGTGIGLDQVRSFLKRCHLGIQVTNFNNNVVFTISK